METRTIKSTSKVSAITDDIVLRESSTTRLLFRPMLIDNPKNTEASVKGTFIHQRKSVNDVWKNHETTPLSSLKAGEGYKLELKSSDLLRLFKEIRHLYSLHSKEGIPKGKAKYVKANNAFESIAQLTDDEISLVAEGKGNIGGQAIVRLINWANKSQNFKLMFESLEEINPEDLSNINVAIGLSRLKKALLEWHKNKNETDEEVWQALFTRQEFLLEQVLHIPMFIIKAKAYMGGKSVLNDGGSVVDFLVGNKITRSVALIEIKTPYTPLLGKLYRNKVFNVSSELSGSVMQVLNYRDTLAKEKNSLLSAEGLDVDVFDPKCFVIIGSIKNELDTPEKLKSFELFRRQFSDVEIITYDELYNKIKSLIGTLEGSVNQ